MQHVAKTLYPNYIARIKHPNVLAVHKNGLINGKHKTVVTTQIVGVADIFKGHTTLKLPDHGRGAVGRVIVYNYDLHTFLHTGIKQRQSLELLLERQDIVACPYAQSQDFAVIKSQLGHLLLVRIF